MSNSREHIRKQQAERMEFLLKFRTTTKDGHPTFDLEKYYNQAPIEELVTLRDKTIVDLQRNPNFGTRFYSELVEYLNKKIDERK